MSPSDFAVPLPPHTLCPPTPLHPSLFPHSFFPFPPLSSFFFSFFPSSHFHLPPFFHRLSFSIPSTLLPSLFLPSNQQNDHIIFSLLSYFLSHYLNSLNHRFFISSVIQCPLYFLCSSFKLFFPLMFAQSTSRWARDRGKAVIGRGEVVAG